MPVHAPEGGFRLGRASTHDMYAFETVPNGDIIRLAAVATSRKERRVVRWADRPTGSFRTPGSFEAP